MMEQKLDYIACFKVIHNYIKTHFQKSIKCIRSDSAPHFSTDVCVKFYIECGIVHKKSCMNRPQQNARAEMKHRHVLR